MRRACTGATKFSPRLPSASHATATSISRKKSRARCWRPCAPSCTTGARAMPCGWRSRSRADAEIVDRLRMNFELDDSQVFRTDGPVNLSRLMNLASDTPRPDLKFPPFVPHELRLNRKSTDLFDELRHRDILLHHPYDSYDGVVGFIQAAAQDPNVVSMKQTLYRTSADSPIFQALTEAAQNKEVTAVVELMARFDEASNIRWARDLEDAGVQVFHGIVGPEDALQAGADGAPRSRWRRAPLRTPRHRQLQPEYRALLHRPEPSDLRSRDHRQHGRGVQLPDRAFGVGRLRSPAGRAAHPGRELYPTDPSRDRACRRRARRRASSPR